MSSQDARFEDADESPLYLSAQDTDDLAILSALIQDAVFDAAHIKYLAKERRFALLLNRFRWEDRAKRIAAPERVQSVFAIQDVQAVSSQGIDQKDKTMVYSVLAIQFETDEDPENPAGQLTLTLAGDGAIRLQVESLNLLLKDVTRPYLAPSKHTPSHPET